MILNKKKYRRLDPCALSLYYIYNPKYYCTYTIKNTRSNCVVRQIVLNANCSIKNLIKCHG
jgi:hypothetical protein